MFLVRWFGNLYCGFGQLPRALLDSGLYPFFLQCTCHFPGFSTASVPCISSWTFPIYLPCSRHGLASGTSLLSWFYWGILEASGCSNPGFSSAPASRWRLLQVFQPGYSSCMTPVTTSSDFPLRFLDTSLPLVFRLSILAILLFSMCYVACLDYLRSQCCLLYTSDAATIYSV